MKLKELFTNGVTHIPGSGGLTVWWFTDAAYDMELQNGMVHCQPKTGQKRKFFIPLGHVNSMVQADEVPAAAPVKK